MAAAQELAKAFLALEQACTFYPEGHRSRQGPQERLHALLLAEAGSGCGSLGVAGESLLWRGEVLDDPAPVLKKFAAALASQGIARLEWNAQLTGTELQDFVGRLASGRGIAHRRVWDEEVRYEHLRVDVPDYQALMGEGTVPAAGGPRRDRWLALLRRALTTPEPQAAADELELLRGAWEGPETLAGLLVEGIGEDARSGAPAAVEPVRRLAALVERASSGCPAPAREEMAARFGALGARLPPALRLRLLEAALEGAGGDLFARAFGALPTADGLALLGSTFALDAARIERLTRVFQHLVPRRLERLELAPRLREEVRRAEDPDEPLAENVWEEALELLTGEAGDFMSPSYREQLNRLAARELGRRDGEARLASVPEIVAGLAPEPLARTSLSIQSERLRLASGLEGFRDALEGLTGLCRVALAAGDGERGLRVLAELIRCAAGEEPLAGPRAEVERALRGLVEEPVLAALATRVPALAGADLATVRALINLAPEAASRVLLEMLIAGAEGARRRGLVLLLRELGPAAMPELVRRLEEAPPAAARELLPLLAAAGGPIAAPALLAQFDRPDPRLRREALRALQGCDTPEVRRVLARLLQDPDEELALAAAAHLGAIGSPEIVAEQLRALTGGIFSGPPADQAQRALAVLGRMRAREAVGPLSELLLRRGWLVRRQEQVREGAALALARIGGVEAKRALEQQAARGSGPASAACRRLLSRWGSG